MTPSVARIATGTPIHQPPSALATVIRANETITSRRKKNASDSLRNGLRIVLICTYLLRPWFETKRRRDRRRAAQRPRNGDDPDALALLERVRADERPVRGRVVDADAHPRFALLAAHGEGNADRPSRARNAEPPETAQRIAGDPHLRRPRRRRRHLCVRLEQHRRQRRDGHGKR